MSPNQKFLFELDSVANAPYYTTGITQKLVTYLRQFEGLQIVEDELAIFVKVGNQNQPPIIIDTHLDHPGFVVGSDNFVHSLGSFVKSKMINKISFPDRLPVNFYTQKGLLLTKGYIFNNLIENNQIKSRYFAENFSTLPANTQVFPVFNTGKKGDYLQLRAADNLATVSVCLSLIETLHKSTDCNLTFIFTKLEEIYQLSATGIAKKQETPFEKIQPSTPIMVLEVAPVLTKRQTDTGDLAVASSENIFETLNPNSSLLGSLKKVCEANNTNLHFVSIHSHGNSISYRLVAKNTETICLTAGNFNRHNIDENGNIAPEIVGVKSLLQMTKVIKDLVSELTANYPKASSSLVLSKQEKTKRSQLLGAYLRAYPRLKFGKLYPQSVLEYFYFAFYSLLSKLYSSSAK